MTGECGNGVWEPGEDCDGKELDNASCDSLGFTSGTLACHADCTFDTKACKGTENCFDGRDNDGNGDIDCDDAACSASCASSCSMAQSLADPGEVTGNTLGHAAQLDSSCKDPDGKSGSEIVYRVTAAKTGVLDIDLASAALGLTLAARTTCATASSEVDCSTSSSLSIPVTAGEQLFVVVDGYTSTDFGKFTLSAQSREVRCGDGVRDAGEGCDDADNTSGDGCSATCEVESTELEPNDSVATANAYVPSPTDYYYGEIGTPGDVDWLEVQVPTGATSLRATTRDFGDGACGLELLDSYIAIYAADGKTLIAENDDNPTADGFCADLTATDLTPGTYYIQVMASPSDPGVTFPYGLEVDVK
jgi:cysteine-rich repeat protein